MELMHITKTHKTNLLTVLIVLIIAKPVYSQFNFFIESCSDDVGNYTTNSTYQNNLKLLLPSLIKLTSSDPIFGNYSVGKEGIDKAYGLYMCRGDLDAKKCHDCVELASTTILEKCPVQKEAIVWYQECMIRYANRSIFSVEEESPYGWLNSTSNVTEPEKFGEAIGTLMNGLIMEAANNESSRGYAIGNVEYTGALNVYGHVQCTPDILGIPCDRCLRATLRTMEGCCGMTRVYMFIFFPSCWMRYDLAPFIPGQSSTTPITTPPPSTPLSSPPDPSPPLSSPPALSPPLLPLPSSPPESFLLPPPPNKDGSSGGMIRSYKDIFMIGVIMVLSMLFA